MMTQNLNFAAATKVIKTIKATKAVFSLPTRPSFGLAAFSIFCLPFGKYPTHHTPQPPQSAVVASLVAPLATPLDIAPNEFCTITNNAFQPGEKLTYKV